MRRGHSQASDSGAGRRRWRPSHGTVVAYVALFVALGTGGAWAAATIGPNDIKSNAIHTRHIKGNAVKTAKIAPGAVKTSRIADGAVTGGKVGSDTLTGDNIDESSLGQVPNASQADSAGLATNSLELGGTGAQGWQRSCRGGAIAGHVYVKGSATFPPAYTGPGTRVLDAFNCTGAATPVQVKRFSTGVYYVDFPGIDQGTNNQLLVAAGNPTVDSGGVPDITANLTYKFVFDSAINKTVFRVAITTGNGTLADREFSFTLMGS